jgi:hypothetical protein
MKLGHIAIAVLLSAGLAAAQDIDAKSKTKVKVDDGKSMTVTGCVERAPEGGFMLTNVANKDGALGSYMLAKAGGHDAFDDLDKHVGHRVEIQGTAADKGNAKVTVETKTEGTTGKTEAKSELKGDLKGLPFLGVKSIKMMASVCP